MMRRSLIVLLLIVVVVSSAGAQTNRRAFGIEDLYRLKGLADLSLSTNGRTVLFTVSTTDLPRAKKTSHVWMMDVDGQNARELTQGDKDSAGHFSPDGKSISFVRESNGTANIYLLPLGGGEPKQLTNITTGVADPVWSPAGNAIAFSSDVYPECSSDDVCNKKLGDTWSSGPIKAHMADALLYRHWTGWKDGTVTHTFVVQIPGGRTVDLTPGSFDFPGFDLGGPRQYDFAPDGSELAVASNHDATPASSTNRDLWLIKPNASPATPRNVTAANHAFDGSPKYSPDGRYIAYRTQKDAAYESGLFLLAVYDRQAGTSRILTERFQNWIDDYQWSADSRSIYFSGEVEGRDPIYRIDVGTGKIDRVFEAATIDAFEISRDGRTIVYIRRSVGEPAEIYRADLSGITVSGSRRLTHFNEPVASETDIRPAESMWVDTGDSGKVQVFIVKPHGFDPSRKYPLILNMHGGPQQQWTDAFRGDWQIYPGAGYVVAFANPHGSTGYGQDFTAEISGDWGGKPFDDLMKVTDALEKLPYVDRNRMGAMGWSFGGYMMNWFEGHTTRYRALASMMGLYDLRSFYGATEELWFPEWDLKGQPWNSPLYEKWSPSNYVTNFKTPCLVITGERDYRVPYTQGLQMFTALQKMGVPSRLIVYSSSGHWPSWYEMALYYTAHLEWFHRFLGGGDAPWSTEAFLRNGVFDPSSGARREAAKPAPSSEQKPESATTPASSQGKPDQKPG